MNFATSLQHPTPITVEQKALMWLKIVGATIIAFWAGLPTLIQTLVIFMGVDIVTGALVAIIRHSGLSSVIGFRGLAKKLAIVLALVVCYRLDVHGDFLPFPIAEAAAGFFAMNEAISILENCSTLGIPLPAGLVRLLKAGRDKLNNLGSATAVVSVTEDHKGRPTATATVTIEPHAPIAPEPEK